MSETVEPDGGAKSPETERILSPAAQRALAEAEARRQARSAKAQPNNEPEAQELGGRGGLDPARYGDWEVKGLASDF